MGSCMTTAPFVANEGIPGQDKLALDVMKEKLLLTDENISLLHQTFREIDTRQVHYVKVQDLHVYFHLEDTFINRKIFQTFDAEELHFLHYTCSVSLRQLFCICLPHASTYDTQVWNFLSMRTNDLSRYIFYMFCDNRTIEVNIPAFKNMMETIHGKGYAAKKDFKKVVLKFEQSTPHVNIDEFVQFTNKYSSLIDPIKRLQLVMRQTLLGDKFWREMAQRRSDDDAMAGQDYVLEVSMEACAFAETVRKKVDGQRSKHAKPRKPKSNKYAVAMTHINKVLPVANDGDVINKAPSKSPPRKKDPNELVISVTEANNADNKVISKYHGHASHDENSPRRGSHSSNPATQMSPRATSQRSASPRPASPRSGSPRRGSSNGSPRLRVLRDT